MSGRDRNRPADAQPPRLARWLLRRSAPSDALGDLAESWRRRRRAGRFGAGVWYWRQTVGWLCRTRSLRAVAGGSTADRPASLRVGFEDVRDAVRSLRRSPVFSLTCVAVLALGMSAGITVFSIANWVLLRPVPGVHEPDRLVTMRMTDAERSVISTLSHPLLLELRERVAAFETISAYSFQEAHLAAPGAIAPRPVDLGVVTADFFDTLGLRMRLGRGFVADEAAGAGGDPGVVVVSDRLWRDAFGADPGILRRELIVNGRPMRVVGVAAAGFLGPELPGFTDVWTPVAAHEIVLPAWGSDVLASWSGGPWFNLVGRLAPGATMVRAAEQTEAAEAALVDRAGILERFDVTLSPGLGMMQGGRERLVQIVTVMTGAVGFLLLITCANFANLLLARGRRRQREVAIRAAIGAGRARLVRQQLWASTMLSMIGATLGLGAATWLVGLFRTARIFSWIEIGAVQLDLRVAAFAFGSALVCGALFGVVPALATTRGDADLMAGARARGAGGRRLRSGLLVVQLAVSFALVVGTVLVAQTISNLRDVRLGVRPDPVAAFEIKPRLHGYEGDELRAFYQRLLERLEVIPGVDSVSLSEVQPFGRMRMTTAMLPEGVTEPDAAVAIEQNRVSSEFFTTLGVGLLAGRFLEPADLDPDAPNVAVVSRRAAEALFPDGNAVGRTTRAARADDGEITIVGVVADVRLNDADSAGEPWMFRPIRWEISPLSAALQLLTARPVPELIPELRAAMAEVDETLPLFSVGSLRGLLEQRFSQPALLSRTGALFAMLALLLVAAGLYGVLSATVAERRYEFGVRTALGATSSEVARMVLRSALGTALLGTFLGALLSLGAGRILDSLLFGVSAVEPTAFVLAAAILIVVTLAASLLPARRASRLDPVAVLREN